MGVKKKVEKPWKERWSNETDPMLARGWKHRMDVRWMDRMIKTTSDSRTGGTDAKETEHGRDRKKGWDTNTVDGDEKDKFETMAEEWWDVRGSFRPLHAFNPIRTKFVREAACEHFQRNVLERMPWKGLHVLDVGCGGGILSESLARLGADVTGIDVSDKHIHVANIHRKKDEAIESKVQFRRASAEQLAQKGEKYDLVVCSEVIEHVRNVPEFCHALANITKPDGGMFITTINRTVQSYLLAIVGAEYATRLVPIGTHDWTKFITPEELSILLGDEGMELDKMSGVQYNPIFNVWETTADNSVNYMAYFRKRC